MSSNEDVAQVFYNRAIEMGIPAPTAAEIFSPGRRSSESFHTAAGHPALNSGAIPYPYYYAPYNAGPATAQYANHAFDAAHEDNVSSMSPNRQSQTYYSQGGSQGPVTSNTGLRTASANAQLQHMVHPMGQFQYPHTGIPYGQYPTGPYPYYHTQPTGSGAALYQYMYPQTDNQNQSGAMPAGTAEESESH